LDNEGVITVEHINSGSAPTGQWGEPMGPIVLIEDPVVRKFLRNVLERHGFRVVEATPRSARDLANLSGPDIALVITNTPGSFLPFAERIRIVYVAACPDYALASLFRSCRVLQKPFHPDKLLEAVKDLADSL